MKIILASKSPARKKLLSQLGLKFEVVPAEIDEDKIREKSPSATVKKIALLKAKTISRKLKKVFNYSAIAYHLKTNRRQKETVIISADTMVYLPQKTDSSSTKLRVNSKQLTKNENAGNFIGKPRNKTQAKQILTALSGTTHWLYSGVCVLEIRQIGQIRQIRRFLDFDKSKVTFRKLSAKEIEEYVNNNPIHLWAGAYTIEKGTPGASFIKKISGSSSNVLGLPVKKLKRIFKLLKLPK